MSEEEGGENFEGISLPKGSPRYTVKVSLELSAYDRYKGGQVEIHFIKDILIDDLDNLLNLVLSIQNQSIDIHKKDILPKRGTAD